MITIILTILLTTIFLTIAVFAAKQEFKQKRTLPIETKRYVQDVWSKIENLPEDNLKEAIFEADKLLDYVLSKKGATGHSIMNKIKQKQKLFKNPDLVFKAHKLRNRLAHEMDFHPTKSEMIQAIGYFKGALMDLDIFKY